MQWINVIFQIWDVTRDANGNPISATPALPQPLPGNAIWAGFGGFCQANNDGDPIVLYDHLADRWLLSQFSVDEGIQCVALSQTPDPAGPYDRWAFVVSPGEANDYPKFGVMPDAYYLSLRDFPSSNGLASAVAFDRATCWAGGAAHLHQVQPAVPRQRLCRRLPAAASRGSAAGAGHAGHLHQGLGRRLQRPPDRGRRDSGCGSSARTSPTPRRRPS